MRRMFVLMYALVFLDEIALLGLVPLLPGYTRAYDLSTTAAGALLSAAPLAIVIASIPAGRLSDRLGSRRVTLAAGVLIVLSTAGMAAAPGFAVLLLARAAFGLASGTIWSAGPRLDRRLRLRRPPVGRARDGHHRRRGRRHGRAGLLRLPRRARRPGRAVGGRSPPRPSSS